MTSDDESRDDADRIVTDVVCGFCGLGCDDLEVAVSGRAIRPIKACAEAARLLARRDQPPPAPRVGGQETTLAEAAAAAGRALRGSRAAAFSGLGADLDGLRRVFDIAMNCGASFDHEASGGLFANLERLGRRGWIATTVAEVRNRCDLLVVFGPDPTLSFGHVFERLLPSAAGDADAAPLFVAGRRRRVVIIGGALSEAARRALAGQEVVEIPVPTDQVALAAQALTALLAGRAVADLPELDGIAPALTALVEPLKAAAYSVFVWNAGVLSTRDAATVAEAAAGAVDVLSVTTRAAVFPLGGRDNITGAHQAALWRFGYPLRTSVGGGTARHAPDRYATATALKDADLLLHVNAFRPGAPADFERGPVIALAHPDTVFTREPDVFIPVGTPGVDHFGHVFRMDSVVCLPLAPLRNAELPSVAEAAEAILDSLRRAA